MFVYTDGTLTFHPDGHFSTTVVASRTLCGHEVACLRLEPVPAWLNESVADGWVVAERHVLVEAPSRLVLYHIVVGWLARIQGKPRLGQWLRQEGL